MRIGSLAAAKTSTSASSAVSLADALAFIASSLSNLPWDGRRPSTREPTTPRPRPELEASQGAAGRPFTTHEKLCQLVDYLRDSGSLNERREGNPSGDGSLQAFRLETGLAVRGVLPLAQPPLAVWILEPPTRPADSVEAIAVGRLFLLEDFAAPDEDGGRYRRMTSWSALAAMLQDWNRKGLGPQSVEKDVYREFARDPLSVIETLGGARGEPHTISSLYRVRTVLLDESGESSSGYAWTTIGYPIVIAEI